MKYTFFYLLILISLNSFSRTIYVKNTGGNGNGLDSLNGAWTLAKLNANVYSILDYDTVSFHSGERFAGQLLIKQGQVSHIVYNKYGNNANPVFDGFTYLSGWNLYSGSIYWVPLSASNINGVVLDNIVQQMGRWPNTGYIVYPSHTGVTSINSSVTIPSNFVGGQLVMKKARYVLDRHKISGQTSTSISYTRNNEWGDNQSYTPSDGNGFIIQGHLNTLDKEGEWFYDAQAQRFYMHFGGTVPSSRNVKVSVLPNIVQGGVSSYITFSNLDFEGSEIGMDLLSCSNIDIVNCNFKYQGDAIHMNYTHDVKITNCKAMYNYNNGIDGDDNVNNVTINGATIYGSGSIVGLGNSGDGTYNGIILNGNGNNVINSNISAIGYNGIYFDGNDILIEHNFVDSCGYVKDDGANIYTQTLPVNNKFNRIIRGNIVTRAIGQPDGAQYAGENFPAMAGIYLDNYTNHTLVENNFIFDCNWAGIFINANSFNSIINNRIYNTAHGLLINVTGKTPDSSGYTRNNTISNNTIIAKTTNQETMRINLYVNDNPNLIASFSNNTYSKPIAFNLPSINVYKWYNVQNTPGLMSLSSWQSTYNQDLNSILSTQTVSSVNDIRVEYNPGLTVKPLSLDAIYRDAKLITYKGTLNLLPYEGQVLFYQGAVIIGGGRLLKHNGFFLKNNGKLLKN